MTIQAINEAYTKRRTAMGRPLLLRYETSSLFPLMPFLVGDLICTIYGKHIAPIPCKFKMAQHKKAIIESYNSFNQDFFKAFNDNERDAVIEYMDEFEKRIYNQTEILRIEILDLVPQNIPFQMQQTLSYIILADVLCWGAIGTWEECYLDGLAVRHIAGTRQYECKKNTNKDLLSMANAVHAFIYDYCPSFKGRQVESMEKFYKLWDGFCNGVLRFCLDTNKETEMN